MNNLSPSVQSVLRKLSRRLAIGLFLEIWPRWAVGSLLLAGGITVLCRIFYAGAAGFLGWLWFVPALSIFPALILSIRRAYLPAEIVALADSLSGGHGTLLALNETNDLAWADAPALVNLSTLPMPRLRPWPRLAPVLAAAAFLTVALVLPQRIPPASSTLLANEIAQDLKSTLAELKGQALITPVEEKQLEEEIERIRKDAMERVDSSSWEAADALREKMAAEVAEKRDAVRWAEESLASLGAAADGGASEAETNEMAAAIEKLAQTGMLFNAPSDLQKLLGGKDGLTGSKVRLPSDPAALRKLAESLSDYLAERGKGFGDLAKLGKAFGRFDPKEFPLAVAEGDGDGEPGVGGVTRGRADAELTWGEESWPFSRFKSVALPPGTVRGPDDWAPVATLPGAPKESPEASEASPALDYAGTAGQAAVRRTLAPRHHSAVKKYFETGKQ